MRHGIDIQSQFAMTSQKRKEPASDLEAQSSDKKEKKATTDLAHDPARFCRVTGSAADAILGSSPYSGEYEAVLRCLQIAEDSFDAKTRARLAGGHEREGRGVANLQAFLDGEAKGRYDAVHTSADDFEERMKSYPEHKIDKEGPFDHPRYPVLRVLCDSLLFDKQTHKLVGIGEIKNRMSCLSSPVPDDESAFDYYTGQCELQAECADVPVVYLTVSSDVNHRIFPKHRDRDRWMSGAFPVFMRFYNRYLSWFYEGNVESKELLVRLLQFENARPDRRVPVDIEAVLAREGDKRIGEAMARARKEDQVFVDAVKDTDWKQLPAPREPPGRFLLRLSKLRSLEGTDEKFCPPVKALREAFHFGAPASSDDGGDGASAYYAKIRARLPAIEALVHGHIEERRQFARSEDVPLVYEWLTYRLVETGQPVLIHRLSRGGKIASYTTAAPYYQTPDEAVAAFLLPPEAKERSVIRVFVNDDDIKIHKIAYSDTLRAGYLRRVRSIFQRFFKWHWTLERDREHEAYVTDILLKQNGGGRKLAAEEVSRLLAYKEMDEAERKRVCAGLI